MDQEQSIAEQESYRLSELARAAGVSKDMVNYYLRAELIPKAPKIRRNLALYNGNHLALIKLIHRFQQEAHLSLSDIAKLFIKKSYDPEALEMELLAGTYVTLQDDVPEKPDNDLENVDLDQKFLDTLYERGLIKTKTAENRHDRKVAALIMRGVEAGLSLKFFGDSSQAVQSIILAEKKSLVNSIDGLASYNSIQKRLREVDQIVDRWMTAEKKRQIDVLASVEQLATLDNLPRYVHRPSYPFLEQYGLLKRCADFEKKITEKSITHDELVEYFHLLVSIGEIDHMIDFAERFTEEDPEYPHVVKFLALGYCLKGDVEKSVALATLSIDLNSEDVLAKAVMGFASMLQAAESNGIVSPMRFVNQSIKYFEESFSTPSKYFAERVEATFLSIMSYLIARSGNEPSESPYLNFTDNALKRLLARIEEERDSDLFDGWRELSRVRCLFFLSEVQVFLKEPQKAKELQEQMLEIDQALAL